MSFFKDKVVLVTGAGGSIGSELCRQILMQRPKKLIMFDNSELALFNIDRELSSEKDTEIVSMLGDITRWEDLGRACYHNPDVVFHAAAYKHVGLCQKNMQVAQRVNVTGTKDVVRICKIFNVPTMVLVSTDKAVRPSCVMGATKQTAEQIVRMADYTVVRLGNVRGSSGSVLPLWKEQIANGEPITITDLGATRYFISAYKAAEGIIVASAMEPGTYVPDMGEPRFLGQEAVNLGAKNFNVIGLRHGEKKHEELFVGERACTNMPGIWKDAA